MPTGPEDVRSPGQNGSNHSAIRTALFDPTDLIRHLDGNCHGFLPEFIALIWE
jgi:hypothetical protein